MALGLVSGAIGRAELLNVVRRVGAEGAQRWVDFAMRKQVPSDAFAEPLGFKVFKVFFEGFS